MTQLISINEAAAQGIERLRKPIWANPMDHLKIDIAPGGHPGIWLHLHAPANRLINAKDPVSIIGQLHGSYDSHEFVPYTGPLPESDEYKAEQALYDSNARFMKD